MRWFAVDVKESRERARGGARPLVGAVKDGLHSDFRQTLILQSKKTAVDSWISDKLLDRRISSKRTEAHARDADVRRRAWHLPCCFSSPAFVGG